MNQEKKNSNIYYIYEVVYCNNEEYEDYKEYSEGYYESLKDALKRKQRVERQIVEDYYTPTIDIRSHKVIR